MKVRITTDKDKILKHVKAGDEVSFEANYMGEVFKVVDDEVTLYNIVEGVYEGGRIWKDLCEPVEEMDYLIEAEKNRLLFGKNDGDARYLSEAIKYIINYLKEQQNE